MAVVPELRITVGGRLALTVAQISARTGLAGSTVRTMLARYGVEPISPPPIDARTPLYRYSEVSEMLRARPGKGWRKGTSRR